MTRTVLDPPRTGLRPDGFLPGGWWHDDPETGRIVCDLCPRACSLKSGDRGFCFVRQNVGDEMVLTTYGRSTGFCVDPIEKKPLNHFYPGTSVLSFGTAGCNLGCKFCQNWDISKSKEVERLSAEATPEAIAEAARQLGCRSVAFTYNDPIIWAEYAIDSARACHAAGVKTVAVTAGYITPEARRPFFEVMDAANVDLKGFTEEFYHKITYSHLQPVLDTLEWLKKETDCWFEITNLVIPEANDSADEIRRMSGWILQHVGDEVPVHFTAFHPDFRMRDRPPTPHSTLIEARSIAVREGLKYVYTGNVDDVKHQSTYCPHCRALVIERNWYDLGTYNLKGDRCGSCGGRIAGRFADRPGSWGRKRLPVEIRQFARPSPDPGPPVHQIGRSPTMTTATETASTALTDPMKGAILSAAAEVVASRVLDRPVQLADPSLGGSAGFPVIGAYVTLKKNGQLRACCGTLGETRRLSDALAQAATITATEDHRLPPISASELPYLELSVNLLKDLRPMTATGRDRIDAVEVGRHGLRIHRGGASGLLLPSVPTEHGWDAESYLRGICRKAGLPTTAWEDQETSLFTFESDEFGGPFDVSSLEGQGTASSFSASDLRALAELARTNLVALVRGGTPQFYAYGVSDGNVAGLALSLTLPGSADPIHVFQLSFRPGMPLQASIFRLCEQAAEVVRRSGAAPEAIRVGVSLFRDPAMHGTVLEPDLRGVDPSRRALLLLEGDKTAWAFDPAETPDELLRTALRELDVLNPASAGLYTLDTLTTDRRVVIRSAPRPIDDRSARRPAVAGKFYPADPDELSRMVQDRLGRAGRKPGPWPAAMVPHAGLAYSGSLAAAVLNRLEIPETVIVIGPKHTRQGVAWAVSPHESWSIPGATIASDRSLAESLVEAIPGLHLDAAAHRDEHAIEVELPWIARLAPEARVVGIVVGGGGLDRCREFARGLAQVVRRLPTPPLLLISSDMNHFANDGETRRLDEIALEAMETLDPARLLATVTEHNISMCGVLPAVIVMETLRDLGGLEKMERVGYATSAEVSGDTGRVVGYAGMLLG